MIYVYILCTIGLGIQTTNLVVTNTLICLGMLVWAPVSMVYWSILKLVGVGKFGAFKLQSI